MPDLPKRLIPLVLVQMLMMPVVLVLWERPGRRQKRLRGSSWGSVRRSMLGDQLARILFLL
ncbi:hypothetical protein [Plantibacter sp. YIM 135347]|uniref:hypothetical protein n=1 Tax=Plantibacter sp. YIM 135347 TaxID=3423919 RepID=UPI003D346B1C